MFEGISVDESGKQHYLDATVAYKRAVLNCIHYLSKFGYTKEQVQYGKCGHVCAAWVPAVGTELHSWLGCTAPRKPFSVTEQHSVPNHILKRAPVHVTHASRPGGIPSWVGNQAPKMCNGQQPVLTCCGHGTC